MAYKPYILFAIHLFHVILIGSLAIQLWLSTRFDLSNIVVWQGAIIGAIAMIEIASIALSEEMVFSTGVLGEDLSEWFKIGSIFLLPFILLVQTSRTPRIVSAAYRTKVYMVMFFSINAIIWGTYIYVRFLSGTIGFIELETARTIVIVCAIMICLWTFYAHKLQRSEQVNPVRHMVVVTNTALFVYLVIALGYVDIHSFNFLFVQASKIAYVTLMFRMMYFVSVEQPYLRLAQKREQMQTMAYYDDVTNLPNKRYLPTLLELGRHTMFVAIKIERLPYIRSILGEDNANAFIRLFVQRVQHAMPRGSVLGRLDENHLLFACERQLIDEQIVCEQLILALNEPVKMCEYSLQPNTVMGVSMFTTHSMNLVELIEMAQLAMEDAITQQKTFEFYDGKLAVETQQRLQIEHELPSAIANNEMYLEYQPKLNVKTGRVEAVEALLRWRQPSGTFISPMQFIPILERTGMMVKVGRWILQQACADAVSYERIYGMPIQVAVNLSVSQLMQRSIIDDVKNALKTSELAPHLLELEITESMSMNSDIMSTILRQLKELGVQVAIDDFGTGYSSLSYLKDFPADTLKVDRSFVELIGKGRRGEAILETVITLGQKLQLTIVAEGVETAEQLQYVSMRGCHYIQGYYISKPLPFSQLFDQIAKIHKEHRVDYAGEYI
ncbi:MAG: EAL domain-containing protein [Caryophanon sp.]|nr:EAL domain-containing protein [Caryophanon sp.]